jgi:hypothetical protein
VSVIANCIWQSTDEGDEGIFNDSFLDHLFDLVEQTRCMQDDTFNYSVIRLIVSWVPLLIPTDAEVAAGGA